MEDGSDTVLSKGPCPKCGSNDNLVTYTDGHAHCFGMGCGYHVSTKGTMPEATPTKALTGSLLPSTAPTTGKMWEPLAKRKLKPDTLKRFGYFVATYNKKDVEVAPYYSMAGDLVLQKLRFPGKEFAVLKGEGAPHITEAQLFGRHVFGDRFDRRLVITEGELDAMSVAQVLDFKGACVSVNGGAQSAAKCLKANYLWCDRFDEIVLWFDDDAPGQLATEECAKLFKVGKVRVAKAGNGHKDASDLLQANLPGDIEAAIYKAQAWRPKGIINAKDNLSAVLAPTERNLFFSYPPAMAKLQEMTGGMAQGDVIYHVAGTGVGKSAVLREIQHHLVECGHKIAVLSFEDTTRDAMLGLMSIPAKQRLHLLDLPDPHDAKAMAAYNKVMEKWHKLVFDGGLVELFDAGSAEWSMDAIIGYVRYCAKALDCEVIFIDPLSFVAAGLDLSADERRVLDKCAMEFAKAAKEINVHIQVSHHLRRVGQGIPHEEGAPTSLNEVRSSGGLANFAMGVIGWERNQQADGDAWRVTRSRIIKPVRRTGRVGLADVLYYGEDGRLIPSPIPFPPMGKPEGDNKGRDQEFSPVTEY